MLKTNNYFKILFKAKVVKTVIMLDTLKKYQSGYNHGWWLTSKSVLCCGLITDNLNKHGSQVTLELAPHVNIFVDLATIAHILTT